MFLLGLLLCAVVAGSAPARPSPQLTPPRLLEQHPADYPPSEKAAGRQAQVLLLLTVGADGRVTRTTVDSSAGPAFDQAAVASARLLRFAPATLDGKPVPVRVEYRVRFQFHPPPPPQPRVVLARLFGHVLERGTRDPLPGATVVVGQEVATAAKDGAFALEAPQGSQTVRVACAGHEPVEVEATLPAELTVRLRVDDDTPYHATVTANRAPGTVVRTLKPEEAEKVAGTQGDVLRAVADLPGVARPPLGLGMLIVRGGAPEDTKVFLEGDEIPLAFHLGALTAVVNTDTLAGLDFIPGTFPAKFGRATAGVIDLRTRPGKEQLHGYVQADFVNATALVEGPLGSPERGTFIVSVRKSYLDSVLGWALPLAGVSETVSPNFWDYQARVDFKLRHGTLHLGAFGSQDHLGLVVPSDNPEDSDHVDSSNGFHRVYLAWTTPLPHGLTNELHVAAGFDAMDVGATGLVKAGYTVWRSTVRDEIRLRPWSWLELAGGVDLQLGQYQFDFSTANPFTSGTTGGTAVDPTAALITEKETEPLLEPGGYLQATLQRQRLTVVPSLRLDYSHAIHATWLDPRISAAYRVLEGAAGDVTLKAATGLFHEHPRPDLLIPLYGNPNLLPEQAVQASVGAVYQRPQLRFELTWYAAWLSHLPVATRASTLDADGNQTPLNFASTGTGSSRGLELLARWEPQPGRFGWIAYTLSQSLRNDHQGQPEHPYDYDQPNVLTAVGSYSIAHGWSVGARVRYATGNPTSPVQRAVLDDADGSYFAVDGPTNTVRLPDFFELDLRADKEWVFDSWKLAAYLDVLNATNNANAEAWHYNYDYTERTPIRGIPFFPSLGLKGEF